MRNEKRKKFIKRDGITLIVLVITIVVLLILASVTISSLTGDNGLLTKASEAKIMTVLGGIKEEIKLELTEDLINDKNLTVEQLLSDGKVNRAMKQGEDENYYMYYTIKSEAYEGMQGLGKGTIEKLRDVFLIDDDFNIKYIDKSGKEYGDEINEKILSDETEVKFASKVFSEYVSKISGISEEEMKFKWMKNQTTLTISDGNVTSLEDLVFFPNIQSLRIEGDTNLTNLVGVGSCTKLTSIVFYNVNVNSTKGIEECKGLKSFSHEGWLGKGYNLEGFEQCINLNSISISRPTENISSFIEKINNLSNLTALTIKYNTISVNDIQNLNKNLTSLTLYGANISSLSGIEKLTKLKKIDLSNNKITDIQNIQGLTNLTELNLENNQIQDISAISNLRELTTLNLKTNQITSILPLAANTKLENLYLQDNVTFESNKANYIGDDLTKLNKIGEILDRGGNIYLNKEYIALFNNYKKLSFASQNIENIYFLEGITELTTLGLGENPSLKINDEKSKKILNSMTKLKSINLYYNKLDISALNTMPWLETIELWGADVNLKDIEDIISNVKLRIDTKSFLTIANCDPSKITKINVITYAKGDIKNCPDLSKFTNMTELNIPYVQSDSYSFIENMTKLTKLNLNYCNIHNNMPSFANLENLTSLDLKNCYLSSDDLSNLKVLKNNKNLTINLSNNSIIDASALLELDTSCKIYIGGNVNLTQESKDALKARFGSNVGF